MFLLLYCRLHASHNAACKHQFACVHGYIYCFVIDCNKLILAGIASWCLYIHQLRLLKVIRRSSFKLLQLQCLALCSTLFSVFNFVFSTWHQSLLIQPCPLQWRLRPKPLQIFQAYFLYKTQQRKLSVMEATANGCSWAQSTPFS